MIYQNADSQLISDISFFLYSVLVVCHDTETQNVCKTIPDWMDEGLDVKHRLCPVDEQENWGRRRKKACEEKIKTVW